MPYSAEISRSTPTAIVFVVDQSQSMREKISTGQSKAEFLADAINRILYNLVIRCQRGPEVRDYFHIGLIGYSGSKDGTGSGDVRHLLGAPIMPLSKVAANPLRIETRIKTENRGGDLRQREIKFPVWIEPYTQGWTTTCTALEQTHWMISEWCDGHHNSFPPVVIHITDGHPTDGDPIEIAASIRSSKTNDGNALLFNLHVDFGVNPPILYPHSADMVYDKYGRRLFDMSSELPESAREMLHRQGYKLGSSPKAFVYNGDVDHIIELFEIGTSIALSQLDPNR